MKLLAALDFTRWPMPAFKTLILGMMGLAGAFVVATAAHGQQVAISALPEASTPLSGTELIPAVQSNVTVKFHVTDVYNPGAPGNLGGIIPGSAIFTNLTASGIVSGAGWTALFASPPPLGTTSPNIGIFSSLQVNSTITGAAFNAFLASPPAIGNTAPNSVAATTLSASSTVSGAGFTAYLASPPPIGGTAPAAITGTTLNATTGLEVNGNLLCNATLPTVSGSGFGSSPSVVATTSCSMDITVGSGPSAASGTITLPSAPNGWVCTGSDITTKSTTVASLQQTGAGSQTTAIIQNFTDVMGAGSAWGAGDHLRVHCTPY